MSPMERNYVWCLGSSIIAGLQSWHVLTCAHVYKCCFVIAKNEIQVTCPYLVIRNERVIPAGNVFRIEKCNIRCTTKLESDRTVLTKILVEGSKLTHKRSSEVHISVIFKLALPWVCCWLGLCVFSVDMFVMFNCDCRDFKEKSSSATKSRCANLITFLKTTALVFSPRKTRNVAIP